MARLRTFAINFMLVTLSLVTVDVALQLCDWAAGSYLAGTIIQNHLGLLFDPGWQAHSKMYDYECQESINSLGFRDHEVSLDKTHRYRIAAIGDSFTYGWGVNIEDTWCKRLEKNLREQGVDAEVLNLGMPAAGPQQYAQLAEVAIPLLKPDLVIVCILNGDDLQQCFSPLLLVRDHYLNLFRLLTHLRLAGRRDAPLPSRKSPEEMQAWYTDAAREILEGMGAKMRRNYDALEPGVKAVFLEGELNPWLISHSTGEPDYFMNTIDIRDLWLEIRMMGRFLRQTRKAAERSHARIIAVSVPEGFYVNKEAYRNVQRIGFEVVPEMLSTPVVDQAVKMACDRAGVPFYGATEPMRRYLDEPGLYFELDRHLTPRGNALYGDIITPFVLEQMAALGNPGP